ncbi:cation:proton antiporter [Aestuariirhabdus sp. Z084]|uniref:cation:proton antiporter n=1 Tax=Aestuariirhabdus haliotis TaxID=2918751 RepID=UPI00201B40DB|nr:cation:proton antiporter [Aestuariirhabdus haliotis]MCL6414391.1 cation:proton antiporter [Aestuariirhabdus haliotis]MCL6418323.1 cation:proton antiporter [Aestuariirhabdus haliotis]
MYEKLALLAGFVLLYSSIAGGVERTWISGPMIFTFFGLLIGPFGLDVFSWQSDGETLRLLAELTLALVLFTDAAGADMKVLKKTSSLPMRLLLIGLPLTIVLGFVAGVLLVDSLSLFTLALLATMLAPTDAALGKAVVTNESVPDNIRQGLNVESGLNDGICVPILFVFLALALGKAGDQGPWVLAIHLVVEEIGIGLLVGLALAFVTAKLLLFGQQRGWVSHTWIQIPVVALALSCFAVAQSLGGSGFIAAFCGGMLFGVLTRDHRDTLLLAAEGTGDTLALLTWVLFGIVVVGKALGNFSWMILLYSILSLTLIRMLPVFLSLAGTGMDTSSKLFVGWFGPRGLASVVFGVIVVSSGLPNSGPIAMTVTCTVLLSIILHGMSASPLIQLLGRKRDHINTKAS